MQSYTNPSTLEPLVQKLAYRTALSADDRAAIMALPFDVRTMERGKFVVRERELATHSCVMFSGYSIRSKLTATGDRQIVGST